jgi:hypothetical protein
VSAIQYFQAGVPHATYHRSGTEDTQQTYSTHVWMISKLLKHSPRSFTRYVIATCYLRMLRRLNYHVSHSFRRALKKSQTFTFSEQSYEPSASEAINDIGFLSELREIASLLDNKTPKLLGLEKEDASNIYTNNTSKEIHLLLCELLDKFSEYLAALEPIQKKPDSKGQILNQLDLISRVGTMLRFMVRGSAIKKHLKVIDNFLPDREDLAQGNGGDDDEELVSLDHKALPKWKACVDWLELMVTHFDAIQTLIRFISHHPNEVDIKVLFLVSPDDKMFSWKDLLNHKTYFPADRPGATAEDLIAFLSPLEDQGQMDEKKEEKGKKEKKARKAKEEEGEEEEEAVSAEDVMRLVKNLCKFTFPDNGLCGTAIDDIVCKIGLINNCTSAGSQSYAISIIDELSDFKRNCRSLDQDEAIKYIEQINSMLRTLRGNAMLRTSLRTGSPLDTGLGFNGDFHCEGSLTTFCTYETAKLDGFVSCSIFQCCPDLPDAVYNNIGLFARCGGIKAMLPNLRLYAQALETPIQFHSLAS